MLTGWFYVMSVLGPVMYVLAIDAVVSVGVLVVLIFLVLPSVTAIIGLLRKGRRIEWDRR